MALMMTIKVLNLHFSGEDKVVSSVFKVQNKSPFYFQAIRKYSLRIRDHIYTLLRHRHVFIL